MTEIRQLPCTTAGPEILSAPDSYVIDVRTSAEWIFVGLPLLPNLYRISWTIWPGGMINEKFMDEVVATGATADSRIYLLCKSGGRSQAAATALAAAGFTNLTNLSDGFEGDPNAEGQRRCVTGWIAAGLPWRQS